MKTDEKQERPKISPVYVRTVIKDAMKAAAAAQGMKLSEYIESKLMTGGRTK